MLEVLVVLIFLFSLWVFGRSWLLACHKEDCDWLAMPIGFCLVGLIGNVLYFICGLSVQSMQLLFLCALVPCLVMILYRGVDRSAWVRMLAVMGIFLFLALPLFIRGEQYGVFRGNGEDHFNYIDESLAMWGNPYAAYKNNPLAICNYPLTLPQKALFAHKFLSHDVLLHGMEYIYIRPAVGLVLATLLPDGRGNIHWLAFLYVTAIWSLIFAAMCFAWKRVLEAYEISKSLLLLMGPPLAYTVGFWGQYIFDINSWSEIASISLLLAFVFEYAQLLQYLSDPSKHEGKSIVSQYLVTLLLAAGAYLFYPENSLPHAVFIVAATVWWCMATRKILRFTAVASLAFFWVGVLLISSVPNWKGTGAPFIVHQMYDGMEQIPEWMYFDSYWLGIHGNVYFNHTLPAVFHGLGVLKSFHSYKLGIPPVHVFFSHLVHGFKLLKSFDVYWFGDHVSPVIGCISTLSNFILALTGMFFVTPDYATSLWLRSGWIFITVILAGAAVYSLVVILFVRFKSNQKVIFLKAFFLLGFFFLLFLLMRGSLWGFGKGVSYLSAYLFLVLCLGLVENGFGHRAIRIFVIVLIISQMAFGMARLCSARDPNGIGYDNSTYPSLRGGAEIKTQYFLDMDPHVYAHCQGVELPNAASPYYMEYIKQKFTYLRIPYFSSMPVRTFYHQAGVEVGAQPPMVTDCRMGIEKVMDKWVTVKL